jgi:hypothetical protein
MKRLVALGLLAGCNQLFGLDPTQPTDAAVTLPRVQLTFQIANTRDNGGNSEPDPDLELRPLDPGAVVVRVGRVGEPLVETRYTSDGAVEIPEQVFVEPASPWRLEYTFDGIVREVIWSIPRDTGHLVIPVFGRLDRTPPPPNSGYTVQPTGAGTPASVLAANAYITNAWSRIRIPPSSAPYLVDMNAAVGFGAAAGAPGASDRLIFVSYTVDRSTGCTGNGCKCAYSEGAAGSAPPPLVANMDVAVESPWSVPPGENVARFAYARSVSDPVLRLGSALGDRVNGIPSARVELGPTASLAMPAFVQDRSQQLPEPQLVKVLDCAATTTQTATSAFVRPIDLEFFPWLAHERVTNTRTVAPGIDLISGLSTVTGALSPSEPFELDEHVPFAIAPIQVQIGAQAPIDLAGSDDHVPVAVGSEPLQLSFALENPTVNPADFVEVTLYRLHPGGSPFGFADRVTTVVDVASPVTVPIDPALLVKGTEYVFAIAAHRGRPFAAAGDFTQVRFPQAVTTIFTRTFIAQ